jgi:hypothetical protein
VTTPDELERRFTLKTATARFDSLWSRDCAVMSDPAEDGSDEPDDAGPGEEPADPTEVGRRREEALELLALGEVIARKAGYGRQLMVAAARGAGASWSQIGAALGNSKQAAWEAHGRWIDEQTARRGQPGHEGFDEAEAVAARDRAGRPDQEDET